MHQETAVRARLPHIPALNGLRGLAVAAVLLFHADVPGVPGGQFGVTVFFTLSGFLITSLLLFEKHRTGAIALRAFWGRRARRLVPAMLLCFGLAALVVHLASTPASKGIGWDAVAAATWTANWRFILHHQVYADLFSLPSPFQHFWSLAVEEQFYVVFPLLVVAVLGRHRVRLRTGRLAVLLAALIALSTWQAARLYNAGEGLGHAYYGTDSRMAEILVGSLLALALVRPDGLRVLGARARAAVDVLGLAGLVVIGVGVATVHTDSPSLYRGWLLAVALGTAAVVAATVQPRSWVSRGLGLQPLVGLGVISYGVYLFHWPLFLLLTKSSTGMGGLQLFALRIGSTLCLATLSYLAVEAPIRSGRLRPAEGLVSWGIGATAGIAAVVLAAGVLAPLAPELAPTPPAGTAAAAPAAPAASSAPASAKPSAGPTVLAGEKARVSGPGLSTQVQPPTTGTAPRVASAPAPASPKTPTPSKPRPRPKQVPTALVADPNTWPMQPVPAVKAGALKVVVVGDSIANNLGDALGTWAGQRTDVVTYNLAIPACPISRGRDRRVGTSPDKVFNVQPVCGWWDDPTSPRYKAFQQFDPDLVVVHDGVNEVFNRKLPSWDDWLGPEDPRFDQWVTGEYQTAIDRWRAEGHQVLMVNAACADWGFYDNFSQLTNPDRRLQVLNSVVYPALNGVTIADMYDRVCPDGGQYTNYVEGIADGRPDGFHFSATAAVALITNWLGPIVLQAARGTAP